MRAPLLLLLPCGMLLCGTLSACAGTAQQVPPETWRKRLREAMARPVATRAERDDQSRLLADAADQGGLDMMSREEIRAAFGKGEACRVELCERNGFGESDWYYEIGEATGDDVKQLPVLIIGFDHHERAARVWTLTTH